VIAHQVGHVQNLLGILSKAQNAQQAMDKVNANRIQVRVELQADCLAGVWANHGEETWKFIEPGDVEAAMQTSAAIGDDRPFDPDGIVASVERYAIRLDPSSAAAPGSGGISAAAWTWSNK
jgi:hypothetical protein